MTETAKDQPLRASFTVAIDGPAGAGKSTIGLAVGAKARICELESGAMYRALALKAISRKLSFDDEDTLVKRPKLAHSTRTDDCGNRTCSMADVSSRIREREFRRASLRCIPRFGVDVARQREMAPAAAFDGGRDIGRKFSDADENLSGC